MPELEVLLPTLVAALGFTTLIWVISLPLRDSGIMDIFWGPGFVLVVSVAAVIGEGAGPRVALVATLVSVWAFRLAMHIAVRNRGRGEDPRYNRWRREAGDAWWWKSWFKVFGLQGAILWLVSFPLQTAVTSTEPLALTGWDLAGAVVFVVGFCFEAVADWQLLRFKRSGKSGVFREGLWRYSRHPNYFGESVIWMGAAIWVLGIPDGWQTLFGPVLMIWLIIRVSGVRMLDEHMMDAKPEYADYVRKTSGFIPMPPSE